MRGGDNNAIKKVPAGLGPFLGVARLGEYLSDDAKGENSPTDSKRNFQVLRHNYYSNLT